MDLLATYTSDEPPSIILRDIETAEIIHTIEPSTDRRTSLLWRAQHWTKQNGHRIAERDFSRLSNGEADHDLPRI